MPWKHRTRICQFCCEPFWCKDYRQHHCSRECAQRHVHGLGPKDFEPPKTRTPKERKPPQRLRDEEYVAWFWSQVEKTPTCWLWKGHLDQHGYGVARKRDEVSKAYRQAWIITHGDIPDETNYRSLTIRHKCRSKSCVNPNHLMIGTLADNMQDKVRWKRSLVSDALGWNDDRKSSK
jgi:hypothetical protein